MSNIIDNKGNTVKIFSFEELLGFSSLVLASLLIIYYFIGHFILYFNHYVINNYSLSGEPVIILQQTYQFIIYSTLYAILIPINAYLVFILLYRKLKKKLNYSFLQIIARFFVINSILISVFFMISSWGINSDIFFDSSMLIYSGYYFSYYNTSYGFVSLSIFNMVMVLSLISLLILVCLILAYIAREFTNAKNGRSTLTEFKSSLDLFKENFLLFYLINLISALVLFYWINTYLTKFINEFFLILIGINLSVFFLKLIFDLNEVKLSIKPLFKSQIMNLFFFSIIFLQYREIYITKFYLYTFSNQVNNFLMLYIFIGLVILAIRFRTQLKHYSLIIYNKTKHFGTVFFLNSKSLIRKINPLSYVFYYITIRKLNNDDQAVFFAKKFIIIQSKHLKNALPGALPSTIPNVIEKIFEDDIERLQQLFKINNIHTYSNKAILKFVMNTAHLIIKDLQKTLQEHLTLELLKENNDAKSLHINVEELWQKANKIMVQWESTFTDTELKYQDTLLHK